MYLLASMLMAISMAIQLVLYNLYLVNLGFDEEFVGQVAAVVALGIALGGIPSGLAYDHFGGRLTFIVAVFGIMLCMIMRAVSTQRELLLLWAGLNGVANSIYYVSIFPFITGQSSARERPHLYGANIAVWTGFMMVGSFIAGLLPSFWLGQLTQSQNVFAQRASLLSGAALAFLAILPFTRMRDEELLQTTNRRQILPSSQSTQTILKGAIALILTGMVIGLTTPFYNVYFKRIFEADDVIIGTLFSLSQVMGLISAFFLPFIVRKLGLVRGSSLVLGFNAPFILAVGLPIPFALVAFIFLFSSGMERLGEAPLMNLVMEVVPVDDRGAMSGVRLISSYGSQALAGAIGGWLIIQAGYPWLFALAAGIQFLAAGAIWLLFRLDPSSTGGLERMKTHNKDKTTNQHAQTMIKTDQKKG
jgi:MFS family permease